MKNQVYNDDLIVCKILEEVARHSGKNDKEAILNKHKDLPELKKVFEYAYSPTLQFFMRKVPEFSSTGESFSWNEFFSTLDMLHLRKVSGKEAQFLVSNYLSTIPEPMSDLFIRILRKDLKLGCKEGTINKVWKGLIVKPPRMGAASMNEKSLAKLNKIKNLAVELKSDGSYAASVCGEDSTMMSRNGNPLEIDCLKQHLSCGAFNGYALEGELVYNLERATRSEGNGIVTKVVKGTATSQEKDNTFYQIWDCIDTDYYESKGEYLYVNNKQRREKLEEMMVDYEHWCREVAGVSPKIFLIPRKENVSVEEAFDIFEQYVREGYEGAVAKDMDSTWKDLAKPTTSIKIKRKEPADLRVVGWYPAEVGSKYEGLLGGFYCESECGRIKVSVGSGFNDEERSLYTQEQPSIIEVEYDSITKDKRTEKESLFLPIYKRPRYDKDIADSYEEILDKQRIK